MKNLINRLKAGEQKNVVVIGDIMLDEYFFGNVDRISPEAPVPVLKKEHTDWCLGGAANVAANCRHIGFDVTLIGLINESDNEGERVLRILHDHQINTAGIVRSVVRPTTCKKRFLSQNHQMFRMDCESSASLSEAERKALVASIDANITASSTILISDYAKGVVDEVMLQYILQRAQALHCVVMVDPKGPNFLKYRGVNYLKPNSREFNEIVRFFNLPATMSLEEKGRSVCQLLELDGLIITMGEKGIVYIDAMQMISSPAHKREVFDLTGAGDTVFSFLALGVAHNISIEESMLLANCAASVAVSHLKTYAVSLDELIDRSMDTSEKIYHDWATLKIELDWQRADGKRVVFTNGCFDILHPGHMHILKEAKRCGDILVVALNSDESIRRLKGPLRPVNDVEYRFAMMAAIGFVDFVVAFDQDTPQSLIEYLRPDILVKGGDYKKEQIVGYDFVASYGGSMHIVDFVPGVSTTASIQKIKHTVLE